MGQKEIIEKLLTDYNDVFADIMNVLLFDGKQVVSEESLENVMDRSWFEDESEYSEKERDVIKIFQNHIIRIVMLGLEDQTTLYEDEVLRVLEYERTSYEKQLLNGRKERHPVITLVLYFGTTRWNKPTTLYEALAIDDELKPYVSDNKINLFEIAFLEPEQVAKFQSDFRIIADYFVQMRTNKNYVPSKETFRHVDEMQKFSVLTNDPMFEEA